MENKFGKVTDVAFIIATYNQSLYKTLCTIHSITIQKGITFFIIIADDGSENNNRFEIEEYFKEIHFNDYIFLESEKNRGTVSNLARCKGFCSSKYVKMISPGDYIYGRNTTHDWIKYMKKTHADASVCDAVYYREDNGFKIVKEKRSPYNTDIYDKFDKKKIINSTFP